MTDVIMDSNRVVPEVAVVAIMFTAMKLILGMLFAHLDRRNAENAEVLRELSNTFKSSIEEMRETFLKALEDQDARHKAETILRLENLAEAQKQHNDKQRALITETNDSMKRLTRILERLEKNRDITRGYDLKDAAPQRSGDRRGSKTDS